MDSFTEYPISLYLPISSLDKRYKLIKLKNGLLCLLINDPTEKTASCALSVATGAFNDPDKALGLAHLCEHMILAGGSKKFGTPLEFHEELSRNNGFINASTSGEQTTFHFHMPNSDMLRNSNDYKEISPFEKLLEMFASYFEEPLFQKKIISKEIYAINNEHFGNKTNNGKMMFHGLRLLSNIDHPFHRFATGNITTLKNLANLEKVNLQNELTKYFDEFFFANNNMTLCLKGSQSLNVLSKLAVKNFGAIKVEPQSSTKGMSIVQKFKKPSLKNNNSTIIDFDVLNNAWNSKIGTIPLFKSNDRKAKNLICIKSSSASIARLVFPIHHKNFPGLSQKKLKTYYGYWVDIVGEEAFKSFDSYLKSNDYSQESSTYCTRFAVSNDGLVLQLKLTKQGWKNLDTIVNCFLFEYIPQIFENIDKLAQTISEINSVDVLKFLYQDVLSTNDECSTLCADILTKSFQTFVDHDALLKNVPILNFSHDGYSESAKGKQLWCEEAKAFKDFVRSIVTSKNIVFSLLGDVETCGLVKTNKFQLQNDVYFEFEYITLCYEPISEISKHCDFDLPEENVFLPNVAKNTSIVRQALQTSKQSEKDSFMKLIVKNSINNTKPICKINTKNCEYWTKDESHQHVFKSKSLLTMELLSLDLTPSPLNTMFLEVLTEIINLSITPHLYAAIKVGFSFSISPSARGDVKLKVCCTGFTDGMVQSLKLFINTLQSLKTQTVNKSIFRKARVNVRSKYQEAAQGNCFQLSTIGVYISLEKYVWSLKDRLDVLEEDIDVESFQTFIKDYLKNLKLLVFQQGDIGGSFEKINHFLNKCILTDLNKDDNNNNNDSNYQLPGTNVLKKGDSFTIKQKGSNSDPNNAISYFIQTGSRSNNEIFSLTCFTDFLFSLTVVPDLRHKRQIGYVVVGGLRTLTDTCGVQIGSMSSSLPEYLEKSIEEYLFDLENELKMNYDEKKFKEKYVNEFLKIVNSSLDLGTIEDSKTGGTDILNEVQPNFEIGRGNGCLIESQYKVHNKLFNTISLKRYNFQFLNFDEPLDLEYLKNLTLEKYIKFFKQYISPNSTYRSKLSVYITSEMDEKDKNIKMMCLQLEAFLKMKGFNIPPSEIKSMVEKNEASVSGLLKDLYSYFNSQGESMRFIFTGLKEIAKALGSTFKANVGSNSGESLGLGVQKSVNGTYPLVKESTIVFDPNHFRNNIS